MAMSPRRIQFLLMLVVSTALGSGSGISPDILIELDRREELAKVLMAQDKWVEAEKEYRELVAACERAHGPKWHDSLRNRKDLADMLSKQGKHAEAEKEYRTLLATRRQKYRAGNPTVFYASWDLSRCLCEQGKWKEALELVAGAEAEFAEVWGAENQVLKQSKDDRERIEGKLKPIRH